MNKKSKMNLEKEKISTLKNLGFGAKPHKKRNNGKEHTWTVWIKAKAKKYPRQKVSSNKFKPHEIVLKYMNKSLFTIKRMYNAVSIN